MDDEKRTLSVLDVIGAYSAALAAGEPERMAALFADDYELDLVYRDAFASDALSGEQPEAFWASWFASFPEMDYHVIRTVAAEKIVFTQWEFTGVNSGPLAPPIFDREIEPTGRTVRFRGVSVYEIEDGLIRQETTYIDLGTLLVELDIML
ncbi:MAG: nuclear transport factor 2 family protein [Chloroflexota bacterium]|nr:nuclear transport factor 2 family protein [Chloroflexota bacterium]